MPILLIALGGGLSYTGYNESSQTITVTTTQSLITTSTRITTTTSTQTLLNTTTTSRSILSKLVNLEAPGEEYCGLADWVYLTLDAGQLHVSYDSQGGPVDFWMLTEQQWPRWERTRGCNALLRVPATASRFGSSAYEFSTNIPSRALYYFAFLNRNDNSISITFKIDAPYQTEVTLRNYQTLYSTQETTFPTQVVSVHSYPAGLGALFFLGIGLVTVAIVLTIITLRKLPGKVPASIEAVPQIAGPERFCINCGSHIPINARFCEKCGAQQ